jgi:hypothetical protein
MVDIGMNDPHSIQATKTSYKAMNSTSQADDFDKFVTREVDVLLDILFKKDDLFPILLRFHVLTENLLERIIQSQISQGHRLFSHANLSYRIKLELANSLDVVDSEIIGSLRQLNSIRNDASHTIDIEITKDIIERIGRPLGKNFVAIRDRSSDDINDFIHETFAYLFARLLRVIYRLEHPPSLKPHPEAGSEPLAEEPLEDKS